MGFSHGFLLQAWDEEPSLSSFILLPADVAVEEGLFGPEAPLPAARARMGDLLAVSTTAKTLVSPKESWRNWRNEEN